MAAEILQLGLGLITQIGHREVHFRTHRSASGAVALRTADDVFLLASQCADIGVAKQGASTLGRLADLADLDSLLRRVRGGPVPLTGVEVSASFLGRRNFNRYDVEDTVGHALARRLAVRYHSRRAGEGPPRNCTGWRVTLDGEHATLMLRIADRPLHRRDYRQRSVPGSLHPPLAAAMARMADIRPGHTVVDPSCGAGTLLAEAARQQPRARLYGFDLDVSALRASEENAAGLPVGFVRADAGHLPLPDGSIDRILNNPPWGGQVSPGGLLAASTSFWWAELRRVLAPGATATVLLPGLEDLPTGIRHGLVPIHLQRVRISGAQSFLVHLAAPGKQERRKPRGRYDTPM
ncbi:TRM11 family SAM-dependent methyltransferase [Microtetraspora niveoalba]|uniref:TRM11 family SAM-dependent methyltransferase n=1 Tax=Microtetraspora niveoalba TaxID=46175 RepID=UPI000AA07A7D|nr:methyltransferase domain-containing protein [Microtetraspora niveoalba]